MDRTPVTLDISEVVSATGLPASTLHVWERRGLIQPAARRANRRRYDPDVLDRIAVIVVLQRSGFRLHEIAGLLAADAFSGGKDALAAKLDQLTARRRSLDQAIEGLEHALRCTSPEPLECPGFRRHLDGVLPVEQDQRPPTPRRS